MPTAIPAAMPTAIPTAKPLTPIKKQGLLRRGLGELGAFAQNSLLPSGGNPHGKRKVRRGGS
jgi:hypothetical protein